MTDPVLDEAMTSPIPQSVDSERALLGCMMHNPRIVDDVQDLVSGADFYRPAHEVIFDAIVRVLVDDRERSADPVILRAHLQRTGDLGKIGGPLYLAELYGSALDVLSAASYAREVRTTAVRRRLAETGRRITQLGLTPTVDVDEAVEIAATELGNVDHLNGADSSIAIGGPLDEMMTAWESPVPDTVGVATGFHDLDKLLGKLRNGQLVIVGARPRIGKSVLLGDIARHASIEQGIPSLFVSMEMSQSELINRWTAASARVDLGHLIRHELTERDWNLLNVAYKRLRDAPLRIETPGRLNLAGLRSRIRTAIRLHGVRIVFVDYLQLLETGGGKDRREAVDALTRGLKQLAQSLAIPIVVAAQLNRGAADRAPMLSDFREAGEIENSADVAILIDREEVRQAELHPDEDVERPGEADLIVAKNRNGASGKITLLFEGHYTRFSSAAWQHATPSQPVVDITEPQRHQEAQ